MAEERTFAFTNGDILVENVPYAAGEAPTAAEFKALIDAFINAGIMAPASEDERYGAVAWITCEKSAREGA